MSTDLAITVHKYAAVHCYMHCSHWLKARYSCCLLLSDFEESHSAFRDSMPGGFSWEATEVFSGWVPLPLPSLPLSSLPCSLSLFACACLVYSFDHVLTACITCCRLTSFRIMPVAKYPLSFWPFPCLSPLLLPFYCCYPFCLFLLISEEQSRHCDSPLPLRLS